MKTVKRYFAIVFIFVLSMTALAGCGKKDTTVTVAEQSTTEYVDYQGEGETQGGIKTDEEIAALNEEATTSTNSTDEMRESGEAANVDMDGHEPQSSGNFQDYWEGDSYFDLEGYALANGITHVFWENGSGDYVDASDGIIMYLLDNNNKWGIYVYTNNTNFVFIAKLDPRKEFHACLPDTTGNETMVTICKDNNACITMEKLQAVITAIDCIKQAPTSENPFENSGLSLDY